MTTTPASEPIGGQSTLNYTTDEIDRPSVDLAAPGIHCEAIMEGRHVDVVEMDAASHTGVDNMRDQYRHGTRIASTWHHKAKLNAEQIAEIRKSSKSGAEIARELGLSVSTVCRARKGKTYAVLSRSELPALLAA